MTNVQQEVEQWKDIPGFEGFYQASTRGRIRSIDRQITIKGVMYNIKGKVLSLSKNKNGYVQANLSVNSINRYFTAHRLVARTFLPNPNDLPVVNHKDSNRSNNMVSNLEWCTTSHNIRHAIAKGRMRPADYLPKNAKLSNNGRSKKVNQFDLNGMFIREWDCLMEAATYYGMGRTAIGSCARGEQKTAGGYIWRFKEAN